MFLYSDILGLSPYGWDLIFHYAFVEHYHEPPIGFETVIIYLLHQNIICSGGVVVV